MLTVHFHSAVSTFVYSDLSTFEYRIVLIHSSSCGIVLFGIVPIPISIPCEIGILNSYLLGSGSGSRTAIFRDRDRDGFHFGKSGSGSGSRTAIFRDRDRDGFVLNGTGSGSGPKKPVPQDTTHMYNSVFNYILSTMKQADGYVE